MKTLKYKIVAIIVMTLLVACNENDGNSVSLEENGNIGIKVVELSKTSNVRVDDLGIYGLEFGGLSDFMLKNKITKYRYSEGIREHLDSYALMKDPSNMDAFEKVSFSGMGFEKTEGMMEPKFLKTYRANKGEGIEEKVREISGTMFGRDQTFVLKTDSYEIEDTQYIPESITIKNVGFFDESINRYKAYKSGGLPIEYNADPNNKNGVALMILWNGTTQDMTMSELGSMDMGYKNKIVVFDPEDSGVLNIPEKVLSKFPKNANLTLILMRENAKMINKGNRTHYLVTGSEQYEHIVLMD